MSCLPSQLDICAPRYVYHRLVCTRFCMFAFFLWRLPHSLTPRTPGLSLVEMVRYTDTTSAVSQLRTLTDGLTICIIPPSRTENSGCIYAGDVVSAGGSRSKPQLLQARSAWIACGAASTSRLGFGPRRPCLASHRTSTSEAIRARSDRPGSMRTRPFPRSEESDCWIAEVRSSNDGRPSVISATAIHSGPPRSPRTSSTGLQAKDNGLQLQDTFSWLARI